MSSLNSVLNIASSGLFTAQSQLRVVSDNVANVSTPGYIRKVADQQAVVSGGAGAGVDISRLRLAADRFLQAAGLNASTSSAGAAAASDTLDQAQSLFGDPTKSSSFLGGLDSVFDDFASLAADSSSAARGAPLATLQSFLSQAQGLGANIRRLGVDADAQIADKVTQANTLISQIDGLNADISREASGGGDVTGSQNQQSTLIDQLSQLTSVTVTPTAAGGVTVRAADGQVLLGAGAKPAVFSYDSSGPTGVLSVSSNGAPAQPAGAAFSQGAMAALVKVRNLDLPGMGDQLAALTGGVAAALNAAHNAHSAVPAPAALTGRPTALTQTEAVEGFTSGRTAVAVTDAKGVVTQRVDIDWAARTLSVNGGTPSGFTPANFTGQLNAALQPAGGASWSASGALTLTAASGGVSVADDPTAPTSRAGRSFSGFLGLNDLVSAATPAGFATGLSATDASGFSGDATFRISDAAGGHVTDIKVTLPPASGSLGDVVTALNNPVGGLGVYGSFALDGDGRMTFTPRPGTGDTLTVVSDTTSRGAGGPSLTAMFGVGEAARINAVGGLAVRSDIAADGSRLALAGFAWSAGVGQTALSAADDSGADALGQAGKAAMTFATAGGLPGGAFAVSDYAAKLGADVARRSSDASAAAQSAQAVASEAGDRRTAVEGVNLDEELVNLTTYQQSYNASARLVSTVKDMMDTLISMVST